MTNQITINSKSLEIKEYKGQRVVTFKDIDTVHGRPNGTARKRFNDNRKHFIEGVDFFKITPSEFRTAIGDIDKRQRNDITLLTESGYFMIAKSLTDDLSWSVQRQLINGYFRVKDLCNANIEEIVQRAVNTAVSETVKALTENNNNTPLLSEPSKIPENWRKATHRLIQRIAMEYDENPRNIYNQIYSELEERTGCNLYAKLDSLCDRLSDEGTPYKVLESLNNIDVIASDEKLTRVYLSIVKEMAIECGV